MPHNRNERLTCFCFAWPGRAKRLTRFEWHSKAELISVPQSVLFIYELQNQMGLNWEPYVKPPAPKLPVLEINECVLHLALIISGSKVLRSLGAPKDQLDKSLFCI